MNCRSHERRERGYKTSVTSGLIIDPRIPRIRYRSSNVQKKHTESETGLGISQKKEKTIYYKVLDCLRVSTKWQAATMYEVH